MEFEFDEDQRLLQQLVRETVAKTRSLPEEQLWKTYRELGWLEAPPVELAIDAATIELARQIAQMHPFALRQAKRAVNQTLDVQGFYAAIQSVFDIHQTGHGNALSVSGYPILTRLAEMKERIKPNERNT